MKRLVKLALILAVLVVVVVAGGALWVIGNINGLAKRGIETGGSYALGVKTTVQDVSLHVLRGELALDGLSVANPQGFGAPHFLNLGRGEVAVSLGSLQSDIIDVPTFKLSGIDVNLERKGGGSNYKAILDNLQKLKSGGGGTSGGTGKRLIVHNLELSDIKVHADLLGVDGGVGQVLNTATKLVVPIDRVQLSNVGQTGTGVKGPGVTVEQLTSLVVQAVLAAVAEKGGGILPADILGDLRGSVAAVGDLVNLPVSVVGKAGETASQVGQTAAAAVKDAGDAAKKAVDDLGKSLGDGLGGLIPGQKPADKKDRPKIK